MYNFETKTFFSMSFNLYLVSLSMRVTLVFEVNIFITTIDNPINPKLPSNDKIVCNEI